MSDENERRTVSTPTDHKAKTAPIEKQIEENPHRPGQADARLADSGVPVWALVGHFNAIGGDAAQVAVDYTLPQETVEAALAYYHLYKSLIDARLAANSASVA